MEIKVYGADIPRPIKKFDSLVTCGVLTDLVQRIKDCGFDKPTPVQMQAIPLMLNNRDAFVIAPTGSGKTLAFLVGLFTNIQKEKDDKKTIRGLIIAPTKELAEQIYREARTILGPKSKEKTHIRVGLLSKSLLKSWESTKGKEVPIPYPDILVTSPLRLINGFKSETINLDHVSHIVLDEADKLLDLGFLEQLDEILAAFGTRTVRKALFSATIPTGIEAVARTFMSSDPVRILVGRQNAATTTIEQRLVYVGQEDGKLLAIRQMLAEVP